MIFGLALVGSPLSAIRMFVSVINAVMIWNSKLSA